MRTRPRNGTGAPGYRPRNLDIFVIVNLALFLVLTVVRYWDRFLEYRGPGNTAEFLVYAAVVVGGILVLWFIFREYTIPTMLLVALQVGIVMHFSGAFVPVDGKRLYDVYIAGIRYDKYVHFANAAAVSILVHRILRRKIATTIIFEILLTALAVLGLGAVIEIIEYIVCLTIPENGVGGYDNNLQDLIANLCGATTYSIGALARIRASGSGPRTPQTGKGSVERSTSARPSS